MSFVRSAVDAHDAESAGMNGYVNHQNSGQVILINNCGIAETCKSDPDDMPTSDVRVREALVRAVDPAIIDRQLNDGRADLTYDLFSETSRWHTESTWEPDADRVQEILDALQVEVDETFPMLILGAVPEGNMWSPEVHGLVPTSTSGLLFHEAWKGS